MAMITFGQDSRNGKTKLIKRIWEVKAISSVSITITSWDALHSNGVKVAVPQVGDRNWNCEKNPYVRLRFVRGKKGLNH